MYYSLLCFFFIAWLLHLVIAPASACIYSYFTISMATAARATFVCEKTCTNPRPTFVVGVGKPQSYLCLSATGAHCPLARSQSGIIEDFNIASGCHNSCYTVYNALYCSFSQLYLIGITSYRMVVTWIIWNRCLAKTAAWDLLPMPLNLSYSPTWTTLWTPFISYRSLFKYFPDAPVAQSIVFSYGC